MATLEAHGQLVSRDGFESGLNTFGPAPMRSQNGGNPGSRTPAREEVAQRQTLQSRRTAPGVG